MSLFLKTVLFLSLAVILSAREAYALIREVDFSNLTNRMVYKEAEEAYTEIDLKDRVFVLDENRTDPSSVLYKILVMPANGSKPYETDYKVPTNKALKTKPLSENQAQSTKRLIVPESKMATLFVEIDNNPEFREVQTKDLYHQDEIVTLGEIKKVEGDSGKVYSYHKVLVRENSSSGNSYYGLVPVDQVVEGTYVPTAPKPDYNWRENDIISFKNSESSLTFEKKGVEYKASLKSGLSFQFLEDVDGGKKGNIIRLRPGKKKSSKNISDYEIINAGVIMDERLIPFDKVTKTSTNQKVDEISEEMAKEEIKKINSMMGEASQAGIPKADCPDAAEAEKAQKSELTTQILCASRKVSGVRSRKIGDIYIEKLGPIFEKMLKSPYGPTTETEKIHFVAQLLHETGGFNTMIERRPGKCWQDLDKLVRDRDDKKICGQFNQCAKEDNQYFSTPTKNSKGVVLNYTHKDKFRGRFPIQLTHCYNYLGFFQHLDQLKKGNTAQAMKYQTNFKGANSKAKSYCSSAEISDIVKNNKKVNLDPLGVLLSADTTKALNNISSPCESQIGGMSSFEIMAQSALWYWKTNPNCKQTMKTLTMDVSSVIGPTKCINGGTNGLADRKAYFNALKTCMKKTK